MASKTSRLTNKALQALLVRIGSASSGTKNLLLDRFKQDLGRPSSIYQHAQTDGKTRAQSQQRNLRVMSIDMGIKNLAYCVANVCSLPSEPGTSYQQSATMNISAWKKIDLVDRAREYRADSSRPEAEEEETDADENLDLYSPAVLSRIAHRLVTQEVLSHEPDIILIERQRWRSGGGSAIQQWTIRVNTLEAMLWAILETLKGSARTGAHGKSTGTKGEYEVFAIDPKRVGHYWLEQHARAVMERTRCEVALVRQISRFFHGEDDPAKAKKISRSKAEKKAKIDILRSWLAMDSASSDPSTPSPYPGLTFTFEPEAESIRKALCAGPKSGARKKVTKKASKRVAAEEPQTGIITDLSVDTIGDADLNKLDDVTDCFLQAAAWVAWEFNRQQLLDGLKKGEEGEVSTLDEAAVMRMILRSGWTGEGLY